MANRRRLIAILIGFALLAILVWGSSGPQAVPVVELEGSTMGTRYKIKLANDLDDPKFQTELQQRIDKRLAKINRLMSTYDPASELSRFNKLQSDEWFTVSEATARVVEEAIFVAEQTSGAFDPTVGPAVDLWGFGPKPRPESIPSAKTIAEVQFRIGFKKIEVRFEPTPALRKQNTETTVDLSAIAKGYGVDQIAELLQSAGVKAAMVEIGGEIRVFGAKPNGEPWRIGIEQPDQNNRLVGKIVTLNNESLATSGDYRNYFTIGDETFSHSIDPRTAKPVQHQLATVTVLEATCQKADAYATSLMVMGPQEGPGWAEKHGIAAYFVERLADGSYRETATTKWAESAE